MKLIINYVDVVKEMARAQISGREAPLSILGVLVFDDSGETAKIPDVDLDLPDVDLDLPVVDLLVCDYYPAVLEKLGLSPLDTAVQYVALKVSKGE